MAYPGSAQPSYMMPMFSIPQVTWASQSPGANCVGKFPNPRSVMRICNNSEAQEFLGRGGQVIIRMRGLPYDCTAKQVIEFFNTGDDPCEVLDEDHGVLFVKKPDGRATGDAFVLFKEEGEGEKALQKHKEIIGSRYIELFRSTTAEVQQVLNRSTEPATKAGVVGGGSAPLIPSLPPVPPMAVIPQQLITAGTRKDCIRLRGLPYEAQVEHILEFLGDHAKNIVYQGVHMVFNAQGQPSGEAFIQMDSEASSFSAANNRHHRYMVFGKKQRYIEVFQCSGEDMSMVLTGGVAGLGHPQPQAKAPLLSPGGSMLGPQATFPYSPLMGGMPHTTTRPPAPGSFSPFPAQLLYWPYPSPPISPNNYFLPPHGHISSPSSLLTPTSSISSLSNGVTSPLPTGGHGVTSPLPTGPQGQGSPQLPQGPPPNTLLTVETVSQVNLSRGAAERPNTETLLRSSVYIH